MHVVELPLGEPPRIASAGQNVHGVHGSQDIFRLPDLWQLHLYRYSAELTVEGTTHPIRPGHVSLVPPGRQVHFRYEGPSEHLYVHLSLSGREDIRTVPVMQDAGTDVPLLSGLLHQAIAAAPRSPARAVAQVWTVLWHVAELGADRQDGPFAAAVALIESRLADPLTVPEVARAAGISHNQLTRVFRAETGDTVVGYLRRRRLTRARHLLRESTLPIARVAAAVGIPDLQAFNKACRRELGASPRTIRAGAPRP